jgi:hypothetical protein
VVNPSSEISPISSLVVALTNFTSSGSYFMGGFILGNKSSINLVKIGLSSVTILGKLKSLKALMSKGSSGISGSALLSPPAYLSTDFTALRPQS